MEVGDPIERDRTRTDIINHDLTRGVEGDISGIAGTVSNVNYHLPPGQSGLETPMRIGPGRQGEAIVIKQRMQMPTIRNRSDIAQR